MAITDYSTTAASNTSVGGVDIQGTAAASNVDNGMRAIMADIATALAAGTFSATGYVAKSAGYTVATTDRGKVIDCTAALELELPAAATAGAAFMFWVKANGGAVTVDPNGTENINGASTSLTVADGTFAAIVCTGSAWHSFGTASDATSFSDAAFTVTDDGDATKKLAFQVSGVATATTRTLTVPDASGTVALTSNLVGQQTMWIPAAAMIPSTTSGAAAGTMESSTNDVMSSYLAFDASSEEFAQFAVQMPKGWDEGTFIAQFVWTHPSTVTNFGVTWGIEALALANDDALDTAWGTEVDTADTGGTTSDVYISPESSAVTPAGSPGAEEYVAFRVTRVVGDAGDTMAVDALLLGVKIHYTTNSLVDD